ncbi:MAG: aminopeptidase P family protein [Deltaproteobacteria bacterium]|nr:aminopeptidase P family protein [Deltaproteobacteria bacterium]
MPAGGFRIDRLVSILQRRRIDMFLCVRLTNIRYLCGFSGSDGILLVSPGGATFLTDGRYEEQSRAEVAGAEVVVSDRKWKEASRRIRRARPARIGYESRHLTVEQFRLLSRKDENKWVPLPDPVEELRMRKDREEILAIENSAVVASGALLSVLSGGFRGRSESEVAADIERKMKALGAEETSFRPIVASGPRAAMPHAVPISRRIGAGEAVIVDFGARKAGYCSDETVTLLPERPSSAIRRAYDAVRRAQDAGIRALRPGTPCREVDGRVRESLDRSGYLKYFVHSTGHGVGLDIHERPSLSVRSGDRLAEGMVVTVEPGVYLPGEGGIRLEDMLRIAGTRGERITYLPKTGSRLV